MGNIISRCINRKKRSIIFIGPPGSGKTSLIHSIKKEKSIAETSTNIYEQYLIRGKGYALDIFDLSGDPKHAQFWKFYTESSHLVLFVIDASTKTSILSSKQAFETFYTSYCMQKENLVFLLNKMELAEESERDSLFSLFQTEFRSICGVSKRLITRTMIVDQNEPEKILSFICKSLKK
ncbi:hypothetical protein NEFER03_0947 [Nematocida sp. LUAm3]|nr:hypothetical protein NEFER03_0947 [Nematocida sp. LUAm3]KAI5174965.1 hypothetical protein NEFER02_1065 [Nematocida sp. LUAm2]KAI5177436.1 hypothetical protein NEFER01_0686 [Nematocida sp. LUAm1]